MISLSGSVVFDVANMQTDISHPVVIQACGHSACSATKATEERPDDCPLRSLFGAYARAVAAADRYPDVSRDCESQSGFSVTGRFPCLITRLLKAHLRRARVRSYFKIGIS